MRSFRSRTGVRRWAYSRAPKGVQRFRKRPVPSASRVREWGERASRPVRRALRRDVKRYGDMLSLDIEKEVLAALSGHVGVFFYGVAGSPLALMRNAQNPSELARSIGLMVVLKFKDASSVDNLLSKVLESAEGRVSMRPFVNLPDDTSFKVLSFEDSAAAGAPAGRRWPSRLPESPCCGWRCWSPGAGWRPSRSPPTARSRTPTSTDEPDHRRQVASAAGERVWKSSSPTQVGRSAMRATRVISSKLSSSGRTAWSSSPPGGMQ